MALEVCSFHSFTHSCPVFRALLSEEAVSSLHCIFFLLLLKKKKKGVHRCIRLSLGFLFHSICLYFSFLKVLYCLDDLALYYGLKSGRQISPALFSLSQACFGYSGLEGLVPVFWWVELDTASLKGSAASSGMLWSICECGVALGSLSANG